MSKTNTPSPLEGLEEGLEAKQKQSPADRTLPSQETKRERKNRLRREAARMRYLKNGKPFRVMRRARTAETKEFIMENCDIDPDTGCWNWRRAVSKCGYGVVRKFGGPSAVSVHRVAWEIWNGKIEGGLFVCHRCDNKICCNPDHLFLGTQKDNVRDAVRKGRVCHKVTKEMIPNMISATGTLVEAGKKFGVGQTTMHSIRHGLHRLCRET